MPLSNEELYELTQHQLRRLGREKRQALDEMDQNYHDAYDKDAAGDAGERILNIEARERLLVEGLNRHVQSQAAPPPLSPEEKQAKPIEKCDWSDAWEWASKSKHGVDQQVFERGMAEVIRRRRSGE
jgi:hypothetical protein